MMVKEVTATALLLRRIMASLKKPMGLVWNFSSWISSLWTIWKSDSGRSISS